MTGPFSSDLRRPHHCRSPIARRNTASRDSAVRVCWLRGRARLRRRARRATRGSGVWPASASRRVAPARSADLRRRHWPEPGAADRTRARRSSIATGRKPTGGASSNIPTTYGPTAATGGSSTCSWHWTGSRASTFSARACPTDRDPGPSDRRRPLRAVGLGLRTAADSSACGTLDAKFGRDRMRDGRGRRWLAAVVHRPDGRRVPRLDGPSLDRATSGHAGRGASPARRRRGVRRGVGTDGSTPSLATTSPAPTRRPTGELRGILASPCDRARRRPAARFTGAGWRAPDAWLAGRPGDAALPLTHTIDRLVDGCRCRSQRGPMTCRPRMHPTVGVTRRHDAARARLLGGPAPAVARVDGRRAQAGIARPPSITSVWPVHELGVVAGEEHARAGEVLGLERALHRGHARSCPR